MRPVSIMRRSAKMTEKTWERGRPVQSKSSRRSIGVVIVQSM